MLAFDFGIAHSVIKLLILTIKFNGNNYFLYFEITGIFSIKK